MAHDFKLFPELTNRQMTIYYWDSPHKQITTDFIARVVKVTDGDTIRLETNFRDFDFPLRIARLAAPELNEEGGVESQRALEGRILGEEVNILLAPERVEKWGRLLGEVIHEGINVGQMSKMFGYSLDFETLGARE